MLIFCRFRKILILSVLLLLFLAGCKTSGTGAETRATRLYPEESRNLNPLPDIKITKWSKNAKAACSLTFDDGTLDHYLAAYPILEEYGLKGTFFLMVKEREKGWWNDYGKKRLLMSWKQAREMNMAGHEIGSHSLSHRDLRAISGRNNEDEILTREFDGSVEEIKKKTGAVVTTFAWPYWRYSEHSRETVLNDYIAARTGSIYPSRLIGPDSPDLTSPPVPGAIPSYAIMTGQDKKEWLKIAGELYDRGGWLPICLHGINGEGIPQEALGWEPISEDDFRSILEYISRDDVWTAPFGTVYQYIRERDQLSISVIRFTRADMDIDLSFSMEYTAPLVPVTVEIELPFDWNGKIHSADGTVNILQRDETRILAELIPTPPSDKGRSSLGF